jgi:hypothetical protein
MYWGVGSGIQQIIARLAVHCESPVSSNTDVDVLILQWLMFEISDRLHRMHSLNPDRLEST